MKKLLFPIVVLLMATILLSGLIISCGEPEATTPPATTPTATKPTTTTPAATTPTATTPVATTPAPTTPTPTTGPQKYGGTCTITWPYGLSKTPGWPNDRTNSQRNLAMWTIFEPLVKLQADGTPIPWLATSWEWSSDYTNITFTLRQGVKFHDGTTFTSEAVKLETDQVIATGESNAINWDHWEVLGDYSIRLYLKKFENNFWTTVVGDNMMFFSPAAYEEHGQEWMAEHPIGTGPFKFSSFEKDVALKFVRNDDYWQEGKPYLDEYIVSFVVEPLTQIAALKAGEVDVVSWKEGKDLYDMQQMGYQINSAMGGTGFIMFDTMNEGSVFRDVNIRMAIEYAINKQDIVDAMGYGFMAVNNQMSPPQYASYNSNLPWRNYDPPKAMELLELAGKPDGFPTTIITTGGAQYKALAIQEFLRAVKIDATLEIVDNPKFWDYMRNGWSNAMVVTDFAVNVNYPAFLRGYFPPTSTIDVSVKLPDEVIAKIEPALAEPDPVVAKQLSDELIQMIFDDCSIIPCNSNAMGFVLAPWIRDSGYFEYLDWSIWDPSDIWRSD